MSTPAELSKSAVVVIDLANDFVYAGGVIADAGGPAYQAKAQAVIPPLQRLLAAARRAGDTPGDSELKKWPPHAMRGTKLAEIVPALAPQAGDLVIEKRTYSPFVSSDIDAQLRARGIERLHITGLHTDCCARHTSADAFQRGYDLVWVTDTLAAFTEEAHRAGIDYFKTWYAGDPEQQLRTTDQVIADWEAARAREPEAVGARR
jgi:nicotinamidase-related amidase